MGLAERSVSNALGTQSAGAALGSLNWGYAAGPKPDHSPGELRQPAARIGSSEIFWLSVPS
jgi:hypothetical protein